MLLFTPLPVTSSAFRTECIHFTKIIQNGAVKLLFFTKIMQKILEFSWGVKSNELITYINSGYLIVKGKMYIYSGIHMLRK